MQQNDSLADGYLVFVSVSVSPPSYHATRPMERSDVKVDESLEGLLGRGASGDVKRGWFHGAAVALKSLFLLRTDAASTALLGGGIPLDQREAYLRKFMQVGGWANTEAAHSPLMARLSLSFYCHCVRLLSLTIMPTVIYCHLPGTVATVIMVNP